MERLPTDALDSSRRDARKISLKRVGRMILAVIMGYVLIFSNYYGLSDNVDSRLLQWWFALRGPRAAPQSVVIVRWDPTSYDRLKETTGHASTRRHLARAIDEIAASEARLIVLDFVFSREDPDADEALARSLASAPTVIGKQSASVNPRALAAPLERAATAEPTPLLAKSAKAVMDLQVRTVNDVVYDISMADKRGSMIAGDVRLVQPLRQFVSPELIQPRGRDLINFYGGHLSISHVSLADAAAPSEQIRRLFKDRVVFIGESGAGPALLGPGRDTFLISASRNPVYGVEIHATIAANLLDGTWIRRLPLRLESAMMSLFVFGLTFVVLGMTFWAGTATVAALAALWFGASYFAFCQMYYFVPGLMVFGVIMPAVLLVLWAGSALLRLISRTRAV